MGKSFDEMTDAEKDDEYNRIQASMEVAEGSKGRGTLDSSLDGALKGARVAGKLSGTLWPLTGAAWAGALNTDHKKSFIQAAEAYLEKARKTQWNPTNLESAPGLPEMAEKRFPNHPLFSASDIAPSLFTQKGKERGTLTMDKGGRFDITGRGLIAGALQMATDLDNYIGIGEEGAAAKVLGAAARESKTALNALKDAWLAAKEGRPVATVGSMVKAGARAATSMAGAATNPIGKFVTPRLEGNAVYEIGKRLNQSLPAKAIGVVTNPLSKLLAIPAGKTLYGNPLLPIEQQGEKFGKTNIPETLYQAGVTNPFGLPEKAQRAMYDLGVAGEQKYLVPATEAGVTANMNLPGTRAEVARLKALGDTEGSGSRIAHEMESRADAWVARHEGTPATPDIPGEPAHWNEDATVLTRETPVIPGKPAIEAQPYTPMEISNLKSHLYAEGAANKYSQDAKTALSSEGAKTMAHDLRKEEQRLVDEALGPGKGTKELADINSAYGGLASTQAGQRFVKNRSERQVGQLGEISPADVITGLLGESIAGHVGGAGAILLKKIVGVSRPVTMPIGYALRKLGETRVLDRLGSNQNKTPRGLEDMSEAERDAAYEKLIQGGN